MVIVTNFPATYRTRPVIFRTSLLYTSPITNASVSTKRQVRSGDVDLPPRRIVFGATSDLGRSNSPWPSLEFAAQDALDFFVIAGSTLRVEQEIVTDEYQYLSLPLSLFPHPLTRSSHFKISFARSF